MKINLCVFYQIKFVKNIITLNFDIPNIIKFNILKNFNKRY